MERSSMPDITELYREALGLLQTLITIPSFSREESATADLLADFLKGKGLPVYRKKNNVWAYNRFFKPGLPLILLNSHHDTVKPNNGYTRDPFLPEIADGKLYGLGSTDAGGPLVSLLAVFLYFCDCRNLNYNLAIACTAEEEISGAGGLELIIPELGAVSFAIVGEPTHMDMAIAEKGLLVLDGIVKGKAGHAGRDEGENAIYKAMEHIAWFRSFRFPRESALLGPVSMKVTCIKAGIQHNIIPDRCEFTVDIRTTDAYSHEELVEIIRDHVSCELIPRSMRLKPSFTDRDHPMVQVWIRQGGNVYGSGTLSDQALLAVPSVKIGPGDPLRSHTADECIDIHAIGNGISRYIKWLDPILTLKDETLAEKLQASGSR